MPLGLWLMLGSQRMERPRPTPTASTKRWIWLLSVVVGTVGGIYGIGGGSLLAPVLLLAQGFSAYEVAPATLTATFLYLDRRDQARLSSFRSLTVVRSLRTGRSERFLELAGLRVAICGARLQRHLPERTLRRLLGLIACVVGLRYVQTSIQQPPSPRPAHATTS